MKLRPHRRECQRFINLTSLIDIVFNLLIFFMVATSFDHVTEINLNLPTAESGQAIINQQILEITIDAQGRYYLNGNALPDQTSTTVHNSLQEAIKNIDPNHAIKIPLVINADGQATHQAVVNVMDAARQLGLTQITFNTRNNLN